jgi:hypothetical protein
MSRPMTPEFDRFIDTFLLVRYSWAGDDSRFTVSSAGSEGRLDERRSASYGFVVSPGGVPSWYGPAATTTSPFPFPVA